MEFRIEKRGEIAITGLTIAAHTTRKRSAVFR